jgi:hypothetical protein
MSYEKGCGPMSTSPREQKVIWTRVHILALITILMSWTGLAGAQAVGIPPQNTPGASSMKIQMLHKAAPDECFAGIGSPNNIFPATASECANGSTPKVNQGYVWGLTQAGNMLWYGTSANQLCTVISSVFAAAGIPAPPYETACYVCEFAASNYLKQNPGVPAALGDWRPPHIYSYNIAKDQMIERTPNDPLINTTMGFRSAGSARGVAILAGPVLAPFSEIAPGINLFAFNSVTGQYLGSTTLSDYSDIRIWTNYMGALYTGVQNRDGTGSVLRWTGNRKNPFQFEVVGHLDNEAAYIQGHRGRIYASTWRNVNSRTSPLAGLYMSPRMTQQGLNSAHTNLWTKIWDVGQYEPDPITAAVTQGGALGEEGGYLVFGTLSVPLTAALGHVMAKAPEAASVQEAAQSISVQDIALAIINSQRAIPIFRCCAPPDGKSGNGTAVELLYGDYLLPAYDVATGTWNTVPNNMNAEPRFGAAGFGNPFNTYDWAMANHHGKLYIGTFDWSFILTDLLTANLNGLSLDSGKMGDIITMVEDSFLPKMFNYGADLWYFPTPNSAAVAESQYGVGNYLNYGIRTMVSSPQALIVGTANPMNLMTNPDTVRGGFELLKMTP